MCWVNDLEDICIKVEFYLNLGKDKLLGDYIVVKLGYSCGLIIDLILVDVKGKEFDMGLFFDMFDILLNIDDLCISVE